MTLLAQIESISASSLSLGGVALRVVRKWLYYLFTGSLYVPV